MKLIGNCLMIQISNQEIQIIYIKKVKVYKDKQDYIILIGWSKKAKKKLDNKKLFLNTPVINKAK